MAVSLLERITSLIGFSHLMATFVMIIWVISVALLFQHCPKLAFDHLCFMVADALTEVLY
jgi:hypothetical protein